MCSIVRYRDRLHRRVDLWRSRKPVRLRCGQCNAVQMSASMHGQHTAERRLEPNCSQPAAPDADRGAAIAIEQRSSSKMHAQMTAICEDSNDEKRGRQQPPKRMRAALLARGECFSSCSPQQRDGLRAWICISERCSRHVIGSSRSSLHPLRGLRSSTSSCGCSRERL